MVVDVAEGVALWVGDKFATSLIPGVYAGHIQFVDRS